MKNGNETKAIFRVTNVEVGRSRLFPTLEEAVEAVNNSKAFANSKVVVEKIETKYGNARYGTVTTSVVMKVEP